MLNDGTGAELQLFAFRLHTHIWAKFKCLHPQSNPTLLRLLRKGVLESDWSGAVDEFSLVAARMVVSDFYSNRLSILLYYMD